MKTIYQIALEVLKENTQGLTRDELAVKVGAVTGKEINPQDLKLTELALNGEIRREYQDKQVSITKKVALFFATGQNEQQTLPLEDEGSHDSDNDDHIGDHLFGTDPETGETYGYKTEVELPGRHSTSIHEEAQHTHP